MNHPKPQFPVSGNTFETDGSLVPEGSGLLAWLTSYSSRAIIQEAMQEDLVDRCEAQLTYNTMERVALISEMEVQLSRDNPYAAERFKAIANAYTMRTLRRMIGGDFDGR